MSNRQKHDFTSRDVVDFLYRDLGHAINYMALLENIWSTTPIERKKLNNLTNYWCNAGLQIIIKGIVDSLTMTLCRMSDGSPQDKTCCFENLEKLLEKEEHEFAKKFKGLKKTHLTDKSQLQKLAIARGQVVAHRNAGIEAMGADKQPVWGDLVPIFTSIVKLMVEVQNHFPDNNDTKDIERKLEDAKFIFDQAKLKLFPSLSDP